MLDKNTRFALWHHLMCLLLLENVKASVSCVVLWLLLTVSEFILKTFDGFIDDFILLQAQTVQSLTGQGERVGLQGGVFVCLHSTFPLADIPASNGMFGCPVGCRLVKLGMWKFPPYISMWISRLQVKSRVINQACCVGSVHLESALCIWCEESWSELWMLCYTKQVKQRNDHVINLLSP